MLRCLSSYWLGLLMVVCGTLQAQSLPDYDVVIYGGTSAGVAAAVQVKRMGKSVVLLEPTQRLGGLTTGGLGQTDIGNKAAIGGLAREFYQAVRSHYEQPENWKWQAAEDYQSQGQSRRSANDDAMWTFEPSAALQIYHDWVREHDLEVLYGERLDRSPIDNSRRTVGVTLHEGKIRQIQMESGKVLTGAMFIDATYEGDLMAAAGVSYRVGRESNAEYDETLNGVAADYAVHHQFQPNVSPYVVAGDPSSGLLPGIDPSGPGTEGDGDQRVQAYCFRMCLTDHPDNRLPFSKPPGYDPLQYELLLRNLEAGQSFTPWHNASMPNRKTDVNNNTGFSTDYIGQNYAYPEASYSEREAIVAAHRRYQQGLMWTLANHPRVPATIRQEVSRWGPCRDEFESQDGWQQQLYIREARRMHGALVMTQHHCQGRQVAAGSIGLAAYTMDSHHVQRFVDANGWARNEGDVQVGGFSPYPIGYGTIVPQAAECRNLFVPVALSATHIAFGSIRMEPVFMVLAQSAATAACQAIDDQVDVQQVDYQQLKSRLLAGGQVLEWAGPKRVAVQGIRKSDLPGIVIDEREAKRVGFMTPSTSGTPFVGNGYVHDGDQRNGQQSIRFELPIREAGLYEVRLAYTANANRATNVPVVVHHAGGETRVVVNQRQPPTIDDLFVALGRFEFSATAPAWVELSNTGTDGYVIADAVQVILP